MRSPQSGNQRVTSDPHTDGMTALLDWVRSLTGVGATDNARRAADSRRQAEAVVDAALAAIVAGDAARTRAAEDAAAA